MKCFIYRNLNRKGFVYSFKALEGPHKGRVVAYAEAFTAKDVEFRVSFAGWQRALRERKRNVHAGIIGDVTAIDYATQRLPNTLKVDTIYPPRAGELVRYHPFETHGSFVKGIKWKNETRISEADRISAFRNTIHAINAR